MKRSLMMMPLLLAAMGCGDQTITSEKTVVEPTFGAADSLRSVQQMATVALGDAVEGKFEEDAAFHGYRFHSLPTGRITAEVTQRGSSRGLDTTMFLFGQKSPGNWDRIAFDDDDSWGKLSGLFKIKVGQYDEFMVVIGTANGMGRGKYRLQLDCTNDACIDTSIPDLTSCDDGVYDVVSQCVEDQLDNADWSDDDPAEEWSIEWCVGDGYQDYVGWTCNSGSSTPDFCRASTASLNASSSACEGKLKTDYNVIDTIDIDELDLSATLQDHAEQLYDSNPDGYVDLVAYTVESGATAQEVASSVRLQHGRVRSLEVGATQNRDAFRGAQRDLLPTFDLIEAEQGEEYEGINVYGSYSVAAGAEEYVSIDIAYYPALNIAYAVKSVSGD